MECWNKMLCFKRTTKNSQKSLWFIENETKLLEGLLAASNGICIMPYRVFTVKEVNKATNGKLTTSSSSFAVRAMCDGTGHYIRGLFQQKPVLAKKFHTFPEERPAYVITDIVISLMMNPHKNVLKVLGCCLDFEAPVIIYDHANNDKLLSDILIHKIDDGSLSWSNRLKIATDIANVLAHLHTGFRTPIIHRDLGTKNIVMDQNGVAKLVDFSLCIYLPPGESQVEDMVIGTKGQLDPEYVTTGIVTEKSDVYMFGVILVELLTGQKPFNLEDFQFNSNQINNILEPMIMGGAEKVHQMQCFADLAFRCMQHKGEDRPDILDVAKELSQIERSSHPH